MRMAIEGIGITGAFGVGVEALRTALQYGVVPAARKDGKSSYIAPVDQLTDFIPKRALRRIDHFSKMTLLSACLAIKDANLEGADRSRMGIVIATGYGTLQTTFKFLDSYLDFGYACSSPTHFSNSVHNAAAAHVSIQMQATAPSLTVTQFEMSVPSALLSAQQLAGLEYPEPVVSLAVEPKTIADRDKLPLALEKLQWEDPTFKVKEDPETGQTLLTGMGGLCLEVVVQRLKTDFGVETQTGRPQVVYRETVRCATQQHEIFEREIDGKTHYGEVKIRINPTERKSGITIDIPEQLLEPWPADLAELIREKFAAACQSGTIAGYPLADLQLSLVEVPYNSNKTTDLGISAAISRAISQGLNQAKATLLEPVMILELIAPSEYTGKVMSSLNQKRGQVEGITSRPGQDIVRATVPLLEMFGYMTELRSATKGQGSFTMEFSHFDQAPPETLQKFGIS